MHGKLAAVSGAAALANLPAGSYRATTVPLSLPWLAAVHASVPLVVRPRG